ncbi:tRNA uridine-5-carboxymethylaminomethyl(34) synthesis enzyme MnmG [Sphingomonas morindae]|uniref:tRNA uridine 5-carboxymethylaminomethyl modification enzyme MnmG n=1 Tax=Sphingomonas morindae TaxID=1541170 RepID=A0ABY4XBG2_9SPHN|nr:tRNA uridine-5-carboxymethylaminomethyl(34) synthesis enzyme MnmG [Sphingomonas morindae]USI74296.1 tRNA uridine-5-carboxymethylaminomethyl(34) synthesis enzyme MnmG [Sphingomonas morindae]
MFHVKQAYDVIVVGGGHAGCEAARAAAASGCDTLLLALDLAGVGAMSCNPAVGGVGKGHLVREVDVFGGLIAAAGDAAAIHYRMLNASKGKAVQGPRVQADRRLFRAAVRTRLDALEGLTLAAGEVVDLSLAGGAVAGLVLADDTRLAARAVILATGTFLGGRLFRGEESWAGGRIGEAGAQPLALRLADLGVATGRLKTGTPPRLDGRTIDWSRLARQPSDAEPWTLSAETERRTAPQLFCGITRTTIETHDIIRANRDRSPLFAGAIEGRGPRYCPSIEDKVVRFGDRDGHQIFLEPEGLDDPLIYPNGISTSLPEDVQRAFVRSIPGLEHAEIAVPGYAVEYTHIDPRQLDRSLALRSLPGLFCAGQINGTTGYEEAAAQGLVAGLAAAARCQERAAPDFARADSYIGVLVDDLTVQGVSEPYRMLTARAEHRLHLRADNAEARLGAMALALDVLPEARATALKARTDLRAALAAGQAIDAPAALREEIDADRLYAPYVERQRLEADRLRASSVTIPADFAYGAVAGLSGEMVERLSQAQPDSLAQAARIPGVTPAALTALLAACRRRAA